MALGPQVAGSRPFIPTHLGAVSVEDDHWLPKDQKRQTDAKQTVTQKAVLAPLVNQQQGKESGDHKECGHSEAVEELVGGYHGEKLRKAGGFLKKIDKYQRVEQDTQDH